MNTLPGYDAWKLSGPPEGDDEAFEKWAEANDRDVSAPDASAWDDFYEAQAAAYEDAAERAAEERAEARADRDYEDYR